MPPRILLADDSPSLLNMVESLLTREGYEVITARNGIEALEKIYHKSPDLVILDVIMPKMTGYQVCRILKSDKETKNIPLILLTAQDQQKDKFWGLEAGADKYIAKTSELAYVLIPEVRHLLEKFRDLLRPETLSHRDIDSSEIISLVNSLLDKQLFESTIINEVNNLAVSIQDYGELIKEILLLINKLISYQIGLIFLIDENENQLWVRTNIQLDREIVEQFQEKITREIKDEVEGYILSPINTNVIFDKDEYYEPEICDSLGEIQSYFSKVLYLRNKCVGLFALADKRPQQFNAEVIYNCNLVLKQGLIVIDNAKLYKKTQELAITDGLTQVYNHRYFHEQMSRETSRTTRYKHELSLIMIDIDHFKHFNDFYGHQAGDIVLKEIAHLLQTKLRDVETVARYGGEEFVIILPETSNENAIQVAERLRKTVEEHEFSIKAKYPGEKITISLGVASFPDDAKEALELISKADGFLYLAKEKGRNRVCSRRIVK